MLYEKDYDNLFEGEVNVEQEDIPEPEKKSLFDKYQEFKDKHPYIAAAVEGALEGLVLGLGTGFILRPFLKKQFSRVYSNAYCKGWDACTKYFNDIETVVRRSGLTKNV